MIRWMIVCSADTQPALAPGNVMNCSGAGGTISVMPVDTVISESSGLIEAINHLSTVSETIFQVPAEGLAAAFGAGFVLPCTCYLIAYAVGSLVNFWRR